MPIDLKSGLIAYFYSTIRGMVSNFLGAFGLPVDLVLAGIAYWKRKEWWAEPLFYSALAVFGMTQGQAFIRGLVGGQGATQTKTAVYGVRF